MTATPRDPADLTTDELRTEVTRLTAALQILRADVHHHCGTVAGVLGYHRNDPGYRLDHGALAEHLTAATDAADAALGERPLGEQIAMLTNTGEH